MRRSTSSACALVLTITLAGATAAQEASPEATPDPTADGSDVALEEETPAQPLPVADYWGEWSLHTEASSDRIRLASENAAKAKKKVGFYRTLLGVFDDELRWLESHQPEDCYAASYEGWRAAVEDLRAIGEQAVASARKGDKKGLKRAARQHGAASAELDEVLASVADCVDSRPPATGPAPVVGEWLAKPVYVADGGFVDKSARKLTISDSGNLLLRVGRHPGCRDAGHGLVPMTIKGEGEVVTEGRPGFAWTLTSVECKPKGKGQVKLAGPGEVVTLLAHDEADDVLLMGSGAECYWRVEGGSKGDCSAFWRGTTPGADEADGSPVDQADSEAPATATPEESTD